MVLSQSLCEHAEVYSKMIDGVSGQKFKREYFYSKNVSDLYMNRKNG